MIYVISYESWIGLISIFFHFFSLVLYIIIEFVGDYFFSTGLSYYHISGHEFNMFTKFDLRFFIAFGWIFYYLYSLNLTNQVVFYTTSFFLLIFFCLFYQVWLEYGFSSLESRERKLLENSKRKIKISCEDSSNQNDKF